MIDPALALWHFYLDVWHQVPFLVQPMTVFTLSINFWILIFGLFDAGILQRVLRWEPKSLHPNSERVYSGGRLGIKFMILTAFLWNLFPLATHTLMDLVLGTKTNLVDTETWQALVGSPVVLPTAATNHTLPPATSPLAPDPSVDPWATTVQTVGNTSWAVSLLFPTKPVYEDPTTLMVFLDLVRAVIVWDMVFYFVHIWLHKPWAMQRFHYMHHQVHVCHSIIIYTVHLLDGLFNFAAIAVAPMILEYLSPSALGMHPLSVALFYVFVGTLGGSSHSGYDTMLGSSRYHFVHHLRGDTNFGAIGFMDKVFGTYETFDHATARNIHYRHSRKLYQH